MEVKVYGESPALGPRPSPTLIREVGDTSSGRYSYFSTMQVFIFR